MPFYVVLGCVCLERFREERKFRREKWRNKGVFVWRDLGRRENLEEKSGEITF